MFFNRWTQCNKKLPQKNGRYLVTINKSVTILTFTDGYWNCLRKPDGTLYTDTVITSVLAWRPLPKPFKK